ncbi:hypothetical protein K438DRAFT_2000291 [Mycena galopus ATCC 62051]|nr:hypothetical protein K438DRAFT_2000291 [Mycena galopus ATCC 62051]
MLAPAAASNTATLSKFCGVQRLSVVVLVPFLQPVDEMGRLARSAEPPPTNTPTALPCSLPLCARPPRFWFLNAPAAPFGVYRMAPAGKAAEKNVGMWFAAEPLRMIDAFPACGLGVSVTTDGALYQTPNRSLRRLAPVPSASSMASPEEHGRQAGLIAPRGSTLAGRRESDISWDDQVTLRLPTTRSASQVAAHCPRTTSLASRARASSGSSTLAHTIPLYPSGYLSAVDLGRLRHTVPGGVRGGGSANPDSGFARGSIQSHELVHGQGHSLMTETSSSYSASRNAGCAASGRSHERRGTLPGVFRSEVRTFQSERVRKLPPSGLDTSMLIGFVVRDEAEWVDLRRRVKELPRTISGIQDEPPTWPGVDDDDDDMGLESISDPEESDDADVDLDDGDVSSTPHAPPSSASHAISGAASAFSHTHAHHGLNSTTHSASASNSGARSEEIDTNREDPVAKLGVVEVGEHCGRDERGTGAGSRAGVLMAVGLCAGWGDRLR